MLSVASLGSGSKGNATLVRSAQGCILIDCGFNFRQLSARLVPAGLTPDDLTAVLVTHEHGDHASGIAVLARRTRVPVYTTRGTWRGMNLTPGPKDGCIRGEHSFDLGDVTVRAVTVPHDAREPVQYCFRAGGQQLGVLTDLGHVSPHVVEAYKGCDGLLLEFNHEPELLAEGPYPPMLKRRVGGPFGHLANAQAEGLLGALMPERLQFLLAGHISAQNNRRELVADENTRLDANRRVEKTDRAIIAGGDDLLRRWMEADRVDIAGVAAQSGGISHTRLITATAAICSTADAAARLGRPRLGRSIADPP